MNLSMHNYIKPGSMTLPQRAVSQEAVRRDTITPCVGCDNAPMCASKEIACESYRVYANCGAAICKPSVWAGRKRIPTKEIFKYIWEDKAGRPKNE